MDTIGNAYIIGTTSSWDFPLVSAFYGYDGFARPFVIKINDKGNNLIYSTCLGGGSNYDGGNGIAIDTSGNAYATGVSWPTALYGVLPGGYGYSDAFITKISDLYHTLTLSNTGSGSGIATSNPQGINCGTDCTEVYDRDTEIILTAIPDAGSVFAGWSGEICSGTSTCTVIMNTNKTITATFNLMAPSNLVVETSGVRAVLTWQDNSLRESGFRIERKQGDCNSINPWVEIAAVGVNATAYTDANVSLNTIYSYRVMAYNTYGTSAYSNCAIYAGNQGTSNAPGLENAPGVQTAPGLQKR